MTTTFFNCYFTEIKVVPENWKTTAKKGAPSLNKDWYFWYRFYDPTVMDQNGKIKPMLVIGKGMNKFKTLAERRNYTEVLIQSEIKHLTIDGYNPITSSYMIEQEEEFDGEIDPDAPFIDALKKSRELLSCSKGTKKDMKSVIKGIEKASAQLRFHDYPVCKIGRKHLKKILLRCESIYSLSPGRYNLYRGYLNMLYNELVEQEAVAGNPIRDISKKVSIKKIRDVLTPDERERIKAHLKEAFPRFGMFVALFYNSGGRKTELFQLKPSMVNLQKQSYRCVVKKRKTWAEVERPIKDVAVKYWEFFLKDCREDQFIFGTRFLPSDKPMGNDMPTRYWFEYVKAPEKDGGLNIQKDFYPLKHLNTTETVDYFETMLTGEKPEDMAAIQNAHTSSAMVVTIYDVKNKDRRFEKLKRVPNDF